MDIEKLALYIIREFPNMPFSYFVELNTNDEDIHKISNFMFGDKKYQNRYTITKIFKRNTGNINQYFDRKFSRVKEIMQKKSLK